MAILYDKSNPDEVARTASLYSDLCSRLRANGYQQYRAGVQSWDTLFESAPEFLALNNKLKNALDPRNIIAPGKYGIGKI
jgi:4-cresol dehydrogenase (hydroxylating)